VTTLPDELACTWLRGLFEASLAAVSASTCLPAHLAAHLPDVQFDGRTTVIAVGKAAAEMAAVAVAHFGPDVTGLAVYPPGHSVEEERLGPGLVCIEAGHPVPNLASLEAATRALEIANDLGPCDRLIALISGGGSALLALPAQGVSLAEKQLLTKSLLASGASISDMNCVRKHLSQIKGGRLALAAAPSTVHTFLISDIPGDDPALTASGPTLPDILTLSDARSILANLQLDIPPSIVAALTDPANETPKIYDAAFAHNTTIITARASDAFGAAVALAQEDGVEVAFLGDTLEGPARGLGKAHAELALGNNVSSQRKLILSGGETSVTLSGNHGERGGRNLEYLLALAIGLNGAAGIFAIACDTDGIDGSSYAAGAIITPTTLARAAALGLDAKSCLESHQSHLFFETLGDLIVTGPTRTNVNDFRAILIG
jgi:glycerate 2-kinase